MAVLYEWQVSLLCGEVKGTWKPWFSCLLGSSAAWERQAGCREEAEVCDAGTRLSRMWGCAGLCSQVRGWKGAPLGYGGRLCSCRWELGELMRRSGFALKGLCWNPGSWCVSRLGYWLRGDVWIPRSVVLISALSQWSFKHPSGLREWFVWPSMLLFPLAKCH